MIHRHNINADIRIAFAYPRLRLIAASAKLLPFRVAIGRYAFFSSKAASENKSIERTPEVQSLKAGRMRSSDKG